jgi:UDP-N-acetylmuramate--alanine ligase
MFFKQQHLHFIGIGGIGMSGIAEVLLNLGYRITGSDLRSTAITERLVSLGATVFEGHRAEQIADAKVVVVSSAVDETNPEIQEARRRQIPVIPRGELLSELMRLKFGIAIAGSHGKTTTTSIAATILSEAGLDPTVVVGGRVKTMGGSNARVGKSAFLIAESDESDRSFLKLAPILAVVTNIDLEHLDHYDSIEEIRAAFLEFVNKVPFYGAAILCLDDSNVQQILPSITRRTFTFGRSAQADLRLNEWTCEHGSSRFTLAVADEDLGEFVIRAPGYHNVLNAVAAAAVALELEVPAEKIRSGLAAFEGVDRRFQVKGVEREITVIDDYGHHPTEIEATLRAARLNQYRQIHALFQPHRYTRTAHLMEQFASAFHDADSVLVLPIYAASEPAIEGVDAISIVEKMRASGHRGADHCGSMKDAIEAVVERAGPGDAILTMGAGSITQAPDEILEEIRRRS